MLTTRNLVSSTKEVPELWIWSYYTKTPIKEFDGEEFYILSPFTKEATPSFHFYVGKSGRYGANCFSSGFKGDAMELVKQLYGCDFKTAAQRVLRDYNAFILEHGKISIAEFKEASRYKLKEFKTREWNSQDKNFWSPFNIGTRLLKKYHVLPLESYTLENTEKQNSFKIVGDYIYGYFKSDGTLYKIYQPKNLKYKFVKLQSYIQGSEQIQNRPYMVYCKALKDIMSFESLKVNCDTRAPDSENTLLPEHIIKSDLKTYKKVFCLFDIDDAGIKAAMKYKERYGIQPIFLSYGEKDLSDHIKKFGLKKVFYWIIPLINKYLNYNEEDYHL